MYLPMTRLRTRPLGYLPAVGLAGLLAACGGGQDPEANSSAAEPSAGLAASRLAALPEGRQRATTIDAAQAPAITLVVRARGSLAGNVGPMMQLRVDGVVINSIEVRSPDPIDYAFAVPALQVGSQVDVVFTNDATVNGADRNLYLTTLQGGDTVLVPAAPGTVYDRGTGAAAFDGADTLPGQGDITWNGALRFVWPAAAAPAPQVAQYAVARLLQQATFGATPALVDRVVAIGAPAWVTEQLALPYSADFVSHVQDKYNLGADYRPLGSKYKPAWVAERFWATAATRPDQLRKRVAFALHQMLMVSRSDSNQEFQARAYANYLDTLNKHAFGNYRTLLEEVALSPVMGIYLSHLRNRKEDAATGRLPDENFARELMQLFSIGLHELNIDGSAVLDANGAPVETYTNADVMALAKVFTGYSWGFPDNQLTESNFVWGYPDFSVGNGQGIDLQRMKVYPGQQSTAEKRLFAGKPQAVTIPANASAADNLRLALDALFKHPNLGPFVGRQLIQRLVTSAPSPAYVTRVARAFNNNGNGVRGDMAAVVRAVLLDTEARSANPGAGFGKLREPVLRVAQWMRAFGATSLSGEYMMDGALASTSQRALYAPSVFGYYRPGYVPPNTAFAARGATAPEFQIVNESTVASWVNEAEAMSGSGLGWTGSAPDVSCNYAALAALSAAGNPAGLLERINLLLFAGRMSPALRQALLDAIGGVSGSDSASHVYRARVAVFVALASPEFIAQR